MANATTMLARAETFVEVYQDLMTQLETEMDVLIQGGDQTRQEAAALRVEINRIRALIGFWRAEVSFWRNEINENKASIRESNKLASSS